jgi:hypothetical protein
MSFKGLGVAIVDIIVLVISAVVLVIFGLIFYLVNLWIIKFAAIDILKLNATGDWIVISAAILTAAAMIGSISKKS